MKKLQITIKEQKDEECLPACVLAVFKYWKVEITLNEIIEKISTNSDKLYDWEFKAGELAIKKELKAKIYSNVTQLFDSSWMSLNQKELIKKLKQELNYSKKREKSIKKHLQERNSFFPNEAIAKRITKEIDSAIKFLQAGGKIDFNPISKELIEKNIDKNIPVIASFNPTLLHRMKRGYNDLPDDIKGISWGHEAIISGYDKNNFILSDPGGNFYKDSFSYKVNRDLLFESILRYNGQLIIMRGES